MNSKIPIYFVPGLGANTKIFENIKLSKELFETYFLEWEIPLEKEESISNYAKRMCAKITHQNPVLVGVSFGGVMVQEMSKIINTKKVFLVSSIKNKKELPKRLQLAKATKAYKLFPTNMVENFEAYEKYFLGSNLQKRKELYKTYMSVRNPKYITWAIYNVLHWKQENTFKDIIHIHGTEDGVFPIKHIKNAIKIEKGTHVMILNKAKTISKIIEENLA